MFKNLSKPVGALLLGGISGVAMESKYNVSATKIADNKQIEEGKNIILAQAKKYQQSCVDQINELPNQIDKVKAEISKSVMAEVESYQQSFQSRIDESKKALIIQIRNIADKLEKQEVSEPIAGVEKEEVRILIEELIEEKLKRSIDENVKKLTDENVKYILQAYENDTNKKASDTLHECKALIRQLVDKEAQLMDKRVQQEIKLIYEKLEKQVEQKNYLNEKNEVIKNANDNPESQVIGHDNDNPENGL